jgi:hypothetical protein
MIGQRHTSSPRPRQSSKAVSKVQTTRPVPYNARAGL